MDLIIELAGQGTEQSDVLELLEEAWLELGIKIFTKPLQREVLRNRIFAGSTLMTMWFGLENGIPSADMSPWEFAPTSQQQYQWPKWGQYFETQGEAGEAPDLPMAERAARAVRRLAAGHLDRGAPGASGDQMLEINADQVFSIGLIAGVPQPIAVRDRLQQRAAGGDLQLGAGRPARHLPARHLLVHAARTAEPAAASPGTRRQPRRRTAREPSHRRRRWWCR